MAEDTSSSASFSSTSTIPTESQSSLPTSSRGSLRMDSLLPYRVFRRSRSKSPQRDRGSAPVVRSRSTSPQRRTTTGMSEFQLPDSLSSNLRDAVYELEGSDCVVDDDDVSVSSTADAGAGKRRFWSLSPRNNGPSTASTQLTRKQAIMAGLSEDIIQQLLGSSSQFDNSLKKHQSAVVSTVKAQKAGRKSHLGEEAKRLTRQLHKARGVVRKLAKEARVYAESLGAKADLEEIDELANELNETETVCEAVDEDEEEDRAGAEASGDDSASEAGSVKAERDKVAMDTPLERLRFFEWNAKLLLAQRTAMCLDMYFPRNEGWKMRVYIPTENMYMGAKDVGIERLTAHINMKMGPDGIEFHLSDFELAVQVFQLRFAGKSSTAVALKKIMSPEKVRLGLQGNIIIHAQFTQVGNRQKWKAKKAVFDLKINKTISGAVTAPDSFIRRLINTILPTVVRSVVRKAIPKEIGPPLLNSNINVQVDANVSVHETISPTLWSTPLIKSEEARQLVNITETEAYALSTVLAAGTAAKVSGLPVEYSLEHLHSYVLKFSSGGADWQQLMRVWEERLVKGCGWKSGQFHSLFKSLMAIGRRPLQVSTALDDIQVRLNLPAVLDLAQHMYLKGIDQKIKRAKKLNVPHINYKPLDQIQAEAVSLTTQIRKLAAIAFHAVDQAKLGVNVQVNGGETMSSEFSVSDLEVNTILPAFELMAPPVKLDLPSAVIRTEVDEETEGYHVHIRSKGALPAAHPVVDPLRIHVYLASLGVVMKRGRFLLSSDKIQGDASVHKDLLLQLVGPIEDAGKDDMEECLEAMSSANHVTTTQAELEQAVIRFILPLFFDDSHALTVALKQLEISVSTPDDHPHELYLSISTHAPGTVSVKLDVAKILTDALDLVEIQDRLIGQGMF